MNKLMDLRNYLLARVPALKKNPEQLHTFIDRGHIDYYGPDNYAHKYNMNLRVIVTDWRDSVDTLTLPILEWLTVREQGRAHENCVQFSAQIIDSGTADIEYTIPVKEMVQVHFDGEARTINHVLTDPPATMNDDAVLQFFVNGPLGSFEP